LSDLRSVSVGTTLNLFKGHKPCTFGCLHFVNNFIFKNNLCC